MPEYGEGCVLKKSLLDLIEWDNDIEKWVIRDDGLNSLMTEKNDVAPVIYAKWKFVAGPDEDNNVQVMCDNCGAGDLQALDVIVPYCWKCGARMDGGESNG